MRTIGWFLLFVGFVWLCASAAMMPAQFTALASDLLAATIPHEEEYDKVRLQQDIVSITKRSEQRRPGIFAPACVMLAGGVLLGVAPPKSPRKKAAAALDLAGSS